MKYYTMARMLFLCSLMSITSQAIGDEENPPKGQSLPIPKLERNEPVSTGAPYVNPNETSEQILLLSESFDSNAPGWLFSGDWELGLASGQDPIPEVGSQRMAGINLGTTYENNHTAMLTSPAIALPTTTLDLTLSFQSWFEIENSYDEGAVEITNDGGATWTPLIVETGSSTDWISREFNLLQYAGDTIQIRFRFTTDGSVVFQGWYVDEVQIVYDDSDFALNIAGLSTSSFPFIFLDVTATDVLETGADFSQMDEQNFTLLENGVEQTNYFDVTSAGNGTSRLIDIVFVMDNSGSLSDEQAAVETNMEQFVTNLKNQGVDLALGLVRYGSSTSSGAPILEDNGSLTTSVSYFVDNVWQRNITGGSTEPGYWAIQSASVNSLWRVGSRRVVIIITDETPNQTTSVADINDAKSALDASGATLFAITHPNLYSNFTELVSDSVAQLQDIDAPFTDILDGFSALLGNTYRIRYRSLADQVDAVNRVIKLTATQSGYTADATAEYRPGIAPVITRTPATISLSATSQIDSQSITIEANVEDTVEPLVSSVVLNYRSGVSTQFNAITMTNTSGTLYTAQIPAGSVAAPVVDYYIVASDGAATTTSPINEPTSQPHQISILPNEAPVVSHTPITASQPATDIAITAVATDNTNQLASVTLYYREYGDLLFSSVEMAQGAGNNFNATIPASSVTDADLEYFILATDDFGVSTGSASADTPHFVDVASNPNLDFELGSFLNWTINSTAQSDSTRTGFHILDQQITPISSVTVESPSQGQYWAVTDQDGPGRNILYRDLVIPVNSANTLLEFDLFIQTAPEFSSNGTFNIEASNHLVDVSLTRPVSNLLTTDANDILQQLYVTQPGTTASSTVERVAVDVSALAGETVRFRFIEVDTQAILNAALDDVGFDIDTDGDNIGDARDDDDDGDGISDNDEIGLGLNPLLADSDADGLNDDVEIALGLDPLNSNDASSDFDNDGLSNYDEYILGTDMNNDDSDGDGIIDGEDIEPLIFSCPSPVCSSSTLMLLIYAENQKN